jgi:NADPH:quinone reductase-like Zn-dependent oxidoreductase
MTIPEQMAAVLLTGHGGLDTLDYREDVPVPQPAGGDVLIRVGAAAVNNTDINTRTGWYSKSVVEGTTPEGGAGGFDAAGEGVDAARVGERVLVEPCLRSPDHSPAGDIRYFGSECDGGFAQYTVAPTVHAHAITSEMSDAELASFPCSYSTAENMLTRAGLSAGETVLITGASGGVGSAAVQLAKRRGANVVAVAGQSKADEVKAAGADRVIPRGDDLLKTLGGESVDVVIDVVAGPQWPQLLEILKRGGRYATAGAIAGPIVELDLRTLYLKDLSLFGCTVLERTVFPNLLGYIENGEIRPLVSKTYPLQQIVEAQTDFLAKTFTGKLVLIPPPDRSELVSS